MRYSKLKSILFTVFAFLLNDHLVGQTNHQIWLDFYPHFYINDKLEYYGDAGYRSIVQDSLWSRFYARPSIRYHFNKPLELHGGVGLFLIYNKFESNRFELTPWQGFQLNWPTLSYLKFKHLWKIEERFSWLTDTWSSSFDLRFRYKFSLKLELFRKPSGSYWFFPFYFEGFFPLKNNIEEVFKNRARAGMGIGYNP